jgi:lipocalin
MKIIALAGLMLALWSCNNQFKPLATVQEVDLERYSGTWYEIARFPHSFEKGLKCVSATYSIMDHGKVRVVNRGRHIDDPAEASEAVGTAWQPDADEPGKLKVRFFWPFAGKYWILYLDEAYQHVLVGSPNRKYLWILSRHKSMEQDTYQQLVDKAGAMEFDTSKLIQVKQDCNN